LQGTSERAELAPGKVFLSLIPSEKLLGTRRARCLVVSRG
jgi:hypothetical protein